VQEIFDTLLMKSLSSSSRTDPVRLLAIDDYVMVFLLNIPYKLETLCITVNKYARSNTGAKLKPLQNHFTLFSILIFLSLFFFLFFSFPLRLFDKKEKVPKPMRTAQGSFDQLRVMQA
jgi:hypothetical protein